MSQILQPHALRLVVFPRVERVKAGGLYSVLSYVRGYPQVIESEWVEVYADDLDFASELDRREALYYAAAGLRRRS